MNDRLCQAITDRFGQHTSETKYVRRWNLDGLDIVVDVRSDTNKAWSSWYGTTPFPFALHRTPENKANSNAYSRSPTLKRGHLLEWDLSSPANTDRFLDWCEERLRSMSEGSGAGDS